jgi:transposase-like protein
MKCPKCNSSLNLIKDGYIKKKQRFLCKACSFHFTALTIIHSEIEKTLKRKALVLYLEGFGFRRTADMLNVSHSTIRNWVNEYGNNLKDIASKHKPDMVTSKSIVSAEDLKEYLRKEDPKGLVSRTWLIIGIDGIPLFVNTE